MFNDAKGKVIVVDYSIFSHQSIHVYAKLFLDRQTNPKVFVSPSDVICLTSIISTLCKVGVTKDDIIIFAIDNRLGSWRKQYKTEYKSDRKDSRDKLEAEIPGFKWSVEFPKINGLLERLRTKAPINVVDVPNMEADDIAAVASKYFSDRQVILISSDSDWEAMFHYDNVRIVSPKKKDYPYKIKPANFNVWKKIAKEITSKTHNNLGSEVASAHDYEVKKLIIDLINLPPEITEPITAALAKCHSDHSGNYNEIRTYCNRWDSIYDTKKVISYEKCVKHFLKGKK